MKNIFSKFKKSPKEQGHSNDFAKIKQSSAKKNIDKSQSSKKNKPSPFVEMISSLYENDAELLYHFVSYLPLMITAWIFGGLQIQNTTAFGLIMSVMLLAHYLELMAKARIPYSFSSTKQVAAHVLALILSIGFAYYFENILAGVLLGIYYIFSLPAAYLKKNNVKNILTIMISTLVRMCLLSLLGCFCQTKEIYFPVLIFGIIPAGFLLASDVAFNTKVFIAEGWQRSFYHPKKNKEGVEKLLARPLGLSRLYVLLLVLGPIVPVVFVPIGFLSEAFILAILPLYYMPNMASCFMEELKTDRELAFKTINLALLESFFVFIAALLS